MRRKSVFTNESGQTLIVIVLIISSVSVLFLVSLGLSSRAFLTVNQNIELSKITFTAVEGAMNETLQHAATDPAWPGLGSFSDTYTFSDVDITRTIETTANDVTYEISGVYRGVYRMLQAVDDRAGGEMVFSEVTP